MTQEKFVEWSLMIFTPHQISDSIKSIRWAGHVAYMGKKGKHTGFWWGNLKERDQFEELGIALRIILEWILKKNRLGGHGLA